MSEIQNFVYTSSEDPAEPSLYKELILEQADPKLP